VSEQFNDVKGFGYGRLHGTVGPGRSALALADGQSTQLTLDVAEARVLRDWLNTVLPGPNEAEQLRRQLQASQDNIGRLHGENLSLQDQLDSSEDS
jgi:hypothetical protein